MATFTWSPDWTAKKKKKPRVNKLQFGDGYEQRIADGINTDPEEWSISFSTDPDTVNSIDSFLEDRKGLEAFLWTTPSGNTYSFKCEEWDVGYENPGRSVLSATFVQVFEQASA